LDALPRETEMAPRSTRAACGNTCDR
jgi:hypothetical protein